MEDVCWRVAGSNFPGQYSLLRRVYIFTLDFDLATFFTCLSYRYRFVYRFTSFVVSYFALPEPHNGTRQEIGRGRVEKSQKIVRNVDYFCFP